MPQNLVRKLLSTHLAEGRMEPGQEIGITVDQALLQDATGTLAWLEFEAMGAPPLAVRQVTQYVDHNLLQTGFESPDDHLFLQGVAARYGAVFSKPGNGISHWAHLERFDIPGETMVGADSHTPHAGACGMLAIGAGGFAVAAAMAGEPYRFRMPEVHRVELRGRFPPWVSAKDLVLELLRRHGVQWGRYRVLEFTGPALADLTVPERGTIANMCTELGATSAVFPSDDMTRAWLRAHHRPEDFVPLAADAGAAYDSEEVLVLDGLEPLIAKPHSPGDVVPVREVAGTKALQVAVGSSVNSSFRDLTMVSVMLEGKRIHPHVSMAVSPGSRRVLLLFMLTGGMTRLIRAGVRELEVACGPCIGMGFAPPTRGPSVRTFNRNFRGRSGTADDLVYLCSPETAAATALRGEITDPRDLGLAYPHIPEPDAYPKDDSGYLHPPPPEQRAALTVIRGPNIQALPEPPVPADVVEGEVLLKLGDDVSTDDILPGGARVLPFRSNIPRLAQHTFEYVDASFPQRARLARGGFLVGGENYGQGSSREHAAAAPLFLGVRAVLAKGFARIHLDNLVTYGILPLVFEDPATWDRIAQEDKLVLSGVLTALSGRGAVRARNLTSGEDFQLLLTVTGNKLAMLQEGGALRWLRMHRGGHVPVSASA